MVAQGNDLDAFRVQLRLESTNVHRTISYNLLFFQNSQQPRGRYGGNDLTGS